MDFREAGISDCVSTPFDSLPFLSSYCLGVGCYMSSLSSVKLSPASLHEHGCTCRLLQGWLLLTSVGEWVGLGLVRCCIWEIYSGTPMDDSSQGCSLPYNPNVYTPIIPLEQNSIPIPGFQFKQCSMDWSLNIWQQFPKHFLEIVLAYFRNVSKTFVGSKTFPQKVFELSIEETFPGIVDNYIQTLLFKCCSLNVFFKCFQKEQNISETFPRNVYKSQKEQNISETFRKKRL